MSSKLSVRLKPRAKRDLGALDLGVQTRILRAVERFAETGEGDVKRLKGSEEEYRLRVGDWRIRFEVIHEEPGHICLVLRVLHRREAYR